MVTARLDQTVRRALLAVLVARLAVNGGLRVVYPFLPEIARGLGISLAAASALIAARSVVGLIAPLFPRLAERVGRKFLMLSAVGATLCGCLLTAGAPGALVAGAGFVLIGLAKPGFDVPMQAWFGARVPYGQRGRVLGITELTWALSLLVTVPLSGLLITATDWRAPFVLVAALGTVGCLAVWRLIPADRPVAVVRKPLRMNRARAAVLVVVLLFTVASELLFVVYGAWLEDDLGLTITAIGMFTLVVAMAELAGEATVATISDRVGPRRMIFAGLLTSCLAYAALGGVGHSIVVAIAVVVVWFVSFEVTIVSTIPLVSELATESRDRLLSLMVATTAGGRALGALAAPTVYSSGGIGASGLAAASLVVVAALVLTRVPAPAGT